MGRRPIAPPDPQPARLVGRVLAYDRKLGEPFEVAWTDAIDSLSSLPTDDRLDWTLALNQTKGAWSNAYNRTGEPAPMDPSALL